MICMWIWGDSMWAKWQCARWRKIKRWLKGRVCLADQHQTQIRRFSLRQCRFWGLYKHHKAVVLRGRVSEHFLYITKVLVSGQWQIFVQHHNQWHATTWNAGNVTLMPADANWMEPVDCAAPKHSVRDSARTLVTRISTSCLTSPAVERGCVGYSGSRNDNQATRNAWRMCGRSTSGEPKMALKDFKGGWNAAIIFPNGKEFF